MSAARVELRDIATEDDVEAVMGLRRGPGQDRYLGSMISHFEDAIADAKACPRMWSVHDGASGELVGFVMISDDIPEERLAADDEIVGPYFLWRLLIDERFQGRGYGAATIEAIADYVAAKPNGATLLTSCADGDGSPLPFYIRHGFTHTGEQKWGEHLLALDLESRREAAIGGPA
jgi:diamine N-acetyltransferase